MSARTAGGTPSKSTCCNCPNHSTIPAILGPHSAASCSLTPTEASWASFWTLGGSISEELLLVGGVAVQEMCLKMVDFRHNGFDVPWLIALAEQRSKHVGMLLIF
jgi:hypothetical protein